MKILKPTLTIALLLGTLVCADAWAQGRGHSGGHAGHMGNSGHAGHGAGYVHGGGHGHGYGYRHGRGGVIIGAPLFWPYRYYGGAYYDPYYYSGYYAWPGAQQLYYCDNPRGYYPNVEACLVPWRVVAGTVVPPP